MLYRAYLLYADFLVDYERCLLKIVSCLKRLCIFKIGNPDDEDDDKCLISTVMIVSRRITEQLQSLFHSNGSLYKEEGLRAPGVLFPLPELVQ